MNSTWRTYLKPIGPLEGSPTQSRSLTDKPDEAERAYRALLDRDDLIGAPMAAVLSSTLASGGSSGRSIYFSRFDRLIGDGRLHPQAPLDLFRRDDGTAEASAWRPDAHDWEADPRPFGECLRAWATAINGRGYGARNRAAEELRVPRPTFDAWCDGRACDREATIRRLMTLIDQVTPQAAADRR